MEERRKKGYVDSKSKDGGMSPHISREIAELVKPYCKAHNLNCTHFIEYCVKTQMKVLREKELREWLGGKTKEEIIDLYVTGNNTHL